MPAYRRKMRCAFAEAAAPKVRKPRKPRSELTEEEKLEADAKRMVNKGLKEAKKEWEATLKPWVPEENFSWPKDTVGMYKSDAKSAFNLNEQEVLSLPFEQVSGPSKTFYAYRDVKELAVRKFFADACKLEIDLPGQVVSKDGMVRTFTKMHYDPTGKRRKRQDWMDNPRFSDRSIEAMMRRKEEDKQRLKGSATTSST